jgi:hypothetical protein
MTTVTKINRDTYLRTKNRFYQVGWLDAERGETSQVEMATPGSYMDDYLMGYTDSKSNEFTMEGC